MADNHERYKVETEYTVDDKSSGAAARIERSFRALRHETHKLSERFNDFRQHQRFTAAAMLGVGFGLGAWIEKTKEAVTEFGKAKKAIAGLFSESLNWPTAIQGVDRYQAAAKLAHGVTEELEEVVAQYGGGLEQAASGFRGLTAAVGSAHLKPKQLMELYKQVAATAKATSTDVGAAAELVGRAIMTGSVRPVGVLGKELYSALHAHGKLTKQMGVSGRLNLVANMMKGQKPIADAMSQGIGDSLRKIRHVVDQTFQRIGTPLFNAISKEMGKWAELMFKAEHGAKPLADLIGNKLVAGFRVLKDVTGFLVDNWKVLAGVWAAFKLNSIGGGAAGMLTSVSNVIGGNVGWAMGTFGTGLARLSAGIGPVVAGLVALHLAAQAFTGWVMDKINNRREIKAHATEMVGATNILSKLAANPVTTKQSEKFAEQALKDLIESGALRDGKLDRGAIVTNVSRMGDDMKRQLATEFGIGSKHLPVSAMIATDFADKIISKLEPLVATYSHLLPGSKVEKATEVNVNDLKTKGVQIGPFTGNININQKFDDVDPDRVWVATRRGIQENAERAVQSMHATTFGE